MYLNLQHLFNLEWDIGNLHLFKICYTLIHSNLTLIIPSIVRVLESPSVKGPFSRTFNESFILSNNIVYNIILQKTLEELMSFPTMVSMTHCPKQLTKQLWRLPNSRCVMWPTCESLLSHLNYLWWTLLKTIQHSYFMSTMYHPLHSFVYDIDRISWLG